jgi:hypothetical protein
MFSGAVPALRFLSGYISPYGSRSRGPWSFICAKAVRVMLANPRESFFRVRERFVLSAKVSRKLDIINYESLSLYTLQLVQGYHLLPPGGPGVRQENGTAHLPFPS